MNHNATYTNYISFFQRPVTYNSIGPAKTLLCLWYQHFLKIFQLLRSINIINIKCFHVTVYSWFDINYTNKTFNLTKPRNIVKSCTFEIQKSFLHLAIFFSLFYEFLEKCFLNNTRIDFHQVQILNHTILCVIYLKVTTVYIKFFRELYEKYIFYTL